MMVRSTKVFILCVAAVAQALLIGGLLPPQVLSAQTASAQDPRVACAADVQKLCSNVPQGGGRIIACLKQHKDEVSQGCKQAIISTMQRSGGGGGSTAGPAPASAEQPETGTTVSAPPGPAVQPDTGSTVKSPSSPAAQRQSHSSTTTASGAAQRYFLMKQVKIIDQGLGQGRPAYDLMIPTTWQFKGWVNINATDGGCFADWFAVVGDAKSSDNSVEMQILPQSTWQYIDDPAGQQQMQMQNRKDAQFGMKPCPVRAPIQAADFLRQDMIAKYRKSATLVSVEAFPELDQIVRHRLGLPPTGVAGGGAGAIRTNAARARVTFTDEKGQPMEEWTAAAIVVRAFPVGGHTAYDWHAVMVMSFRAPKGKLDSNDRLFKLMASTIRPEPEWQKWSNGIIAGLYQKKQEELAKQAAMIAAFRQHVADTINGVVANSEAGANHAVYGESQILRGVQTFRDPSTGSTFELSNQFDHAWLNGSNEYVMSDDPTFNPNGNLTGNWSELQVVR